MSSCVSGKKAYVSEQIAEEGLIGAHTQFEYGNTSGPVAVYQCEDCGNYHLTSRGPMNEKLAHLIKEGKISLQKEANQWEKKWRRK